MKTIIVSALFVLGCTTLDDMQSMQINAREFSVANSLTDPVCEFPALPTDTAKCYAKSSTGTWFDFRCGKEKCQ